MIHNAPTTSPSPKKLELRVSGPDACRFLQGQLTCDVTALEDGQSTLGAYCNIQGKVESLFTLTRSDDAYVLCMQAELLQPTLQELQKYAVFSKVKLEVQEASTPQEDNTEQEIRNKIPEIYLQTKGDFFPHDINLPALGAVSFTKGCYRGQEIVARMQHRGKLKRSMYLFNCETAEINPGDAITTQDATRAGTVVRACNSGNQTIGLAVITDALAQNLYLQEGVHACNLEYPPK